MKEWKTYRIGDICKTNTSQYSIKEAWDEFLYLDTGNITRNTIDEIARYSSAAELPSRARRKVICDDIIFSTVRPNQCHFGILSNPPTNLLVSTGFTVITANKEVVDPYYLYYYLSQDSIIDYLHSIGEQAVSAYPSIKSQDIEDLEIELPDLATQNNITKTLRALDNKIELNRKINDNLEQQAQALYKSWFVDFDPFKDGAFKESEFGLIPGGWRVGSLSDLTEITMGQSPSGKSYNETGDGMLFYQGRAEFGDRYPSIRLYTTEPSRIAEQNSVLLSVRAPVGDTNIAYNKCCIGRGLASITAKHGFNSFIFYMIKSLKDQFDLYNGEGTVFGSINRDSLNSMKVIVPTNEVINDFEKIVAPLDFKYKSLFSENLLLMQQRDTLLPKLMSGELKINDLDC